MELRDALASIRVTGDKSGHEFHGNQWDGSKLGQELSAKTWLHGTGHAQDGPLRDPVFLTTSPEGAAWYAQNRGDNAETVVPITVDVKNPISVDSYDDAVKLAGVLKAANIDVTLTPPGKHGWTWSMSPGKDSPYDGDNPLDVVYHPEARKALQAAGFDAVYTKHDVLESGSIDALIPLDAKKQITGKFSKRSLTARIADVITTMTRSDMLTTLMLGGSLDEVMALVEDHMINDVMARALGEETGHDFHGNQWTGGKAKFQTSGKRVGANIKKLEWAEHKYDISKTEQKVAINDILGMKLDTDNALFEAERTGKAMVVDANEKFDMSVDVGAYAIRYAYQSDAGTQIKYHISRDDDGKLVVNHEYFEVPDAMQGKGIAKDVLRSNFAEYERLGVDRVELNADIDAGKYAWARFGYVPASDDDAKKLYGDLAERAKQLKASVDLELELRVEAKKAHPNPELVWKVSDSKDGFKLLAGPKSHNWNGVFDLKNERQTDRLAKYLSAKPKLSRAAGEGEGHAFHGNQWTGKFEPVPDTLYRGTGPGSFDATARDFAGGELGGGIYFTADKSIADGYSEGPGHVTHAIEWTQKPTPAETGYLAGGPSDLSNEEHLYNGLGQRLWSGTITDANYKEHRANLKDAALKAGLKVIIGMHNVSGAGQIAVLDRSALRVVTPKALGLHPEMFKKGVLFYTDENGDQQDRALWEELLGETFEDEPITLSDKPGHEFHGNQYVVGFHGTTDDKIEGIQTKDILPDGNGLAFVTDYKTAEHYAQLRSRGSKIGAKPVIIEVHIPSSHAAAKPDVMASQAEGTPTHKIEGGIPKQWIKSIRHLGVHIKSLGDKPGHDFHGNQWGVGLHSDGTITLLHGTTKLNADAILSEGFRRGEPASVAALIEKEYDLPKNSILNSVSFEFASKRGDLNRVHLTSDPNIAVQYTIPEALQDALRSAWALKHPEIETMTREVSNDKAAWVQREGNRLTQPQILAVRVPWSTVGDHAFGKKISLDEFQNHPHLKGDVGILHSISIPISAMKDAVITRASGPKALAAGDPQSLSPEQVALLHLRLAPGWTEDKDGISKTFSFPNRRASAAFTTSLLEHSNNVNHHPDVMVDGDDVHVTYITHATDCLTEADFVCAEVADKLAAATPAMERAAGDKEGHEFHGNQWDDKGAAPKEPAKPPTKYALWKARQEVKKQVLKTEPAKIEPTKVEPKPPSVLSVNRTRTDAQLADLIRDDRLVNEMYGSDYGQNTKAGPSFTGLTVDDRLRYIEMNANARTGHKAGAEVPYEFQFAKYGFEMKGSVPPGLTGPQLRTYFTEHPDLLAGPSTPHAASNIADVNVYSSHLLNGLNDNQKQELLDKLPASYKRLDDKYAVPLSSEDLVKAGFTQKQIEGYSDRLDAVAGIKGYGISSEDSIYSHSLSMARSNVAEFSSDYEVARHSLLGGWATASNTGDAKIVKDVAARVFPDNQGIDFYKPKSQYASGHGPMDDVPAYSHERMDAHILRLKSETEAFYTDKFSTKKDPNPDLSTRTLTVGRGVGGHVEAYTPSAAESWSLDKRTPERFGKMMTSDKNGPYSILNTTTTYKNVIWSWESVKGIHGWPAEKELKGKKEVVLIGGTVKQVNVERHGSPTRSRYAMAGSPLRVIIPRAPEDTTELDRLHAQGLLASGESYPTKEQLDAELKTLGEQVGHEFHGNQWNGHEVVVTDALLAIAQKESAASPYLHELATDAQGVLIGQPRELDKAINRGQMSLEDVAKGFTKTRAELQKTHGDDLILYRVDAPVDQRSPNTRTVYMGDKILADKFGKPLPYHVATKDVVALYARPSGYYEFIVRKPQDGLRAATLFDTTESEHSGLLVSLHLDLATAKKLSVPDGEDPENMHITLCYCGDVNEIGDVTVARAIVAVNQIVQAHAPLQGTTTELGSFDATEHSDDKDVIIAHVDVPGIFELRQQLADALTAVDAPPRANFEYTPHITLAYVASGDDIPVEDIPTLPLTFTEVRITIGDQTTDIPFGQAPRNLLGWMRYLLGRIAGDKQGHEFHGNQWDVNDSKVIDKVETTRVNYLKSLSPNDKRLVRSFTNQGIGEISQKLREGKKITPKQQTTLDRLDAVVKNSGGFETPITVWRGPRSGFNLPGDSLNDDHIYEKAVAFAESFKPGNEVTLQGITSASLDKKIGEGYGTLASRNVGETRQNISVAYEIETTKGLAVGKWSKYDGTDATGKKAGSDEREVILPQNLKTVVTDVSRRVEHDILPAYGGGDSRMPAVPAKPRERVFYTVKLKVVNDEKSPKTALRQQIVEWIRTAGDKSGHEFHGNQWKAGGGYRSERTVSSALAKLSQLSKDNVVKATDVFKKHQVVDHDELDGPQQLEFVHSNKLIATQDTLHASGIRAYINGKSGDIPGVDEVHGKYYINDGHHRLAAEELIGQHEHQVYVRHLKMQTLGDKKKLY